MNLFKKLFLHSLNIYIIAFVISLAITFLYMFLNEMSFYYFVNGLTIAGLILIIVGGLMTTSYFGSFDMFNYSFGKILRYKKNKNIKLPEYVEQQNIKRKSQDLYFMPYYVVGGLTLLISLLLGLI